MRNRVAVLQIVLLMVPLALACGTLSTTPWPDRSHDAVVDGHAGDASGDAGSAADALAGDVFGANPDVGSQAPSGKWLAPAPGAAVPLATPVTFTAQVSSPYVSPADLYLSVTLTTGPVAAAPLLKAGSDGTVTFVLSTLPPGPQTLVLRIMDGANPATEVPLPIYVDSPPGTPQVAIEPANPHGADDLKVLVQPTADVDLGEAATQTYQYQWLLGEVPSDVTSATLPADHTEPGQLWTVRVWASDGLNLGAPGQASVQIGNTAPILPVLALAPDQPTVADTVVCAMPVPATDADDQGLQFQFRWKLNGQPFALGDDKAQLQLSQAPAVGVLGGRKVLLPLKTGDSLTCEVLVTDGTEIVGPAASKPVVLAAFDGCSEAQFPCALGAACTPTDTAAVTCTCGVGLAGSGTACVDIDECSTGQNACDPAADCTNTFAGYSCGCPAGYTGDGIQCTDVDECAAGAYSCGLASDCSNTAGGYACVCQPGYVGDGSACTDQDECLLGLQLCDPHAACVNLPGSATCACDLGWVATATADGGLACVDLDECASPTDLPACVTGALCSNYAGGYDCTCGPGWSGDGTTCSNIDECNEGSAVCAAEAVCQDTLGDYLCLCGPGYLGDGKTCFDVDECAGGTHDCDPKAACTNTPGGYACACKPGFTGDGKTCQAELP